MLTTVLFDMGGTLEDIWYNEDTQRETCRKLLEVLRANGLEPGCPDDVFWKRITDGVKAYKQWSEGNMLEKKSSCFEGLSGKSRSAAFPAAGSVFLARLCQREASASGSGS